MPVVLFLLIFGNSGFGQAVSNTTLIPTPSTLKNESPAATPAAPSAASPPSALDAVSTSVVGNGEVVSNIRVLTLELDPLSGHLYIPFMILSTPKLGTTGTSQGSLSEDIQDPDAGFANVRMYWDPGTGLNNWLHLFWTGKGENIHFDGFHFVGSLIGKGMSDPDFGGSGSSLYYQTVASGLLTWGIPIYSYVAGSTTTDRSGTLTLGIAGSYGWLYGNDDTWNILDNSWRDDLVLTGTFSFHVGDQYNINLSRVLYDGPWMTHPQKLNAAPVSIGFTYSMLPTKTSALPPAPSS
jgi:hypothetical protein